MISSLLIKELIPQFQMGVKGQAAKKGDFVAFFPMAKEWGKITFTSRPRRIFTPWI